MTNADFVQRIQLAVYQASISGTISLLKNPPGRRPSPTLIELSQWFNQLSADDREHIATVTQLAVRSAVFEMLAVIDNATSIREAGEEVGTLELRYVTESESALINSPNTEFLHDLFADQVPPVQ